MSASTFSERFASFAPFDGVLSHVFGMCNDFKIFYSVVFIVAVFMVDVFAFKNWSAKVFLHHKAVLHDVSVRISAWVISCKQLNIFPSITAATFPIWMSRTARKFVLYSELCRARSRASWFFYNNLRIMALKLSSTSRTLKHALIYSFHGVRILSCNSFIVKGLL